jgi:hypothetical protein
MSNVNLSRTSGGGWIPFLLAAALAAALVLHGCKLAGYGAELTAIAVSPGSATIASITTQQFTAMGRYSDDSERDVTAEVDWASSAPTVTAVSGGLATPAGAGTATITASRDGVSGSATLTVTAALLESIEVTPGDAAIANGTRLQLAATGHFDDQSTQDLTAQAEWTSSDPNVTIGNVAGSKGLATSTALGATTSTITASFDAVVGSTVLTVKAVDLQSLEVTPAAATVTALHYQQFAATGHFSDATTQVMTAEVGWASSDTGVATVSAAGRARGIYASTTPVTITATSSALLGSVSGTAELTVQASCGGY